jgi:hypothetical protein
MSSAAEILKSLYRRFIRPIKFLFQRLTRGFDDSETWSLDSSLSRLILPRLKRYQKVSACHPMNLTPEEWNAILDKMIASFEFHASDLKWSSDSTWQQHDEGIQLFAKYFTRLWW